MERASVCVSMCMCVYVYVCFCITTGTENTRGLIDVWDERCNGQTMDNEVTEKV